MAGQRKPNPKSNPQPGREPTLANRYFRSSTVRWDGGASSSDDSVPDLLEAATAAIPLLSCGTRIGKTGEGPGFSPCQAGNILVTLHANRVDACGRRSQGPSNTLEAIR